MKIYFVLTLLCASGNAHLYSMQALLRHVVLKATQQRAYTGMMLSDTWWSDRLIAMEDILQKRKGLHEDETVQLQDELDAIDEYYNRYACGLPIGYNAGRALATSRFYMPYPFFNKVVDTDGVLRKDYKNLLSQSATLYTTYVPKTWFEHQDIQDARYKHAMIAAEKTVSQLKNDENRPLKIVALGAGYLLGQLAVAALFKDRHSFLLDSIYPDYVGNQEEEIDQVLMKPHKEYLAQRLAAIQALLPKSEA